MQVCVPCWQTVTVVKIVLTKPPPSPVGPKLAVTATELLAAGVGVVAVVLEELFPQLDNARTHITANSKRRGRCLRSKSGFQRTTSAETLLGTKAGT